MVILETSRADAASALRSCHNPLPHRTDLCSFSSVPTPIWAPLADRRTTPLDARPGDDDELWTEKWVCFTMTTIAARDDKSLLNNGLRQWRIWLGSTFFAR
jgi:hypothetical protein